MKNQGSLSLGILLLVFAAMSLFTLSYYLFNMSFLYDYSGSLQTYVVSEDTPSTNENNFKGTRGRFKDKSLDDIAKDMEKERDEREMNEAAEDEADDGEGEDDEKDMKKIISLENEEIQLQQQGNIVKRIKVCTVAKNIRQRSIFSNNLMASLGSKRYYYSFKSAESCPWDWPRVRMIPYVRCCTDMKDVIATINESMETFDVVIITGDEYCAVKDNRPHFRQYYGNGMMGLGAQTNGTKSGVVKFTEFFPLGPRYEFERVTKKDPMHAATQRRFLYNFLGSLTSPSRSILEEILEKLDKKRAIDYPNEPLGNPSNVSMLPRVMNEKSSPLPFRAFVHVTDKWHTKITESGGYVSPDVYRRVLLQSIFTLCPTGHNPEAYRIYEACEAGSIPILSLDKWYTDHECKDAFAPFIKDGAPFIWLDNWNQLGKFLSSVNATFVIEKQQQVRAWYSKWMNDQAFKLEEVMEWRYKKRMARGKPTTAL